MTACTDCGAALVHPEEVPAAADAAPGAPEAALEAWASLARGGPWELRELAEALGAHGLATRIGPYPPPGSGRQDDDRAGPGTGLAIYVAEGDHERVVALHQQLVREGRRKDKGPSRHVR